MSRASRWLAGAACLTSIVAACRIALPAIPENHAFQPSAPPALPAFPTLASNHGPVPWKRPLFQRKPAQSSGDEKNDRDIVSSIPLPRLVGIIVDGDRIAVISRNGSLARMQQNDELDGWKLSRIEARSSLLLHDSRTYVLRLDPLPR